MALQEEYTVKLEVFEGPLDLLLYLIKKEEVDIYHIPLERITNQYMEYLDVMKMLDLNIAGEFLVMAATLMMIKSRMLLPVEERPAELEGEEDDTDPRWDLVRQLVEYKKFKDAAQFLQQLEEIRSDAFTREGDHVDLGDTAPPLQEVGLFDLLTALNQALARVPQEEMKVIFAERFTVGDKIDAILDQVRQRPQFRFSELFQAMSSRHEIIVTFLAMLELIRLKHIVCRQGGQFGEIMITKLGEA